MPSPLPTVRPSEPIRASKQNELIRRVNAVSHLAAGGPLVAAHGAGGARTALRDLRRIAIWQLTGRMDRPRTDGVTDDVPSAPADAVWYFDVDGYGPENKYKGSPEYTRSGRVYHVGGFPGDQRDQIAALQQGVPGYLGTPLFNAGDWVYAEFNPQSARWEIMSPPEIIWRFELKTPLVRNYNRDVPSTAIAYLVVFDPDQGKYVKTDVEFPVADFLDVCEGEPGDRGYAKRLADSHLEAGWEVLIMAPEESSSSGEPPSSSGEPPSSSGEPPSSSGEPPGLTTDVDVVICDPYRIGDYVYFPQKRLRFVDGVLVRTLKLEGTHVYVCCPTSSSGEDSSSGDDSSSGEDSGSGDSGSGEDSGSGDSSSGEESSSGECAGLCGWEWDGSQWIQTSNTCTSGCTCDPPGFSGSSSGEGFSTYCYPL